MLKKATPFTSNLAFRLSLAPMHAAIRIFSSTWTISRRNRYYNRITPR